MVVEQLSAQNLSRSLAFSPWLTPSAQREQSRLSLRLPISLLQILLFVYKTQMSCILSISTQESALVILLPGTRIGVRCWEITLSTMANGLCSLTLSFQHNVNPILRQMSIATPIHFCN